MTLPFFTNADIVVFVYSVTVKETLDHITSYWVEQAKMRADKAQFIVIGNKIDLTDERQTTEEVGRDIADQLNALFVETSLLTHEGLHDLRIGIGRLLASMSNSRLITRLQLDNTYRHTRREITFTQINSDSEFRKNSEHYDQHNEGARHPAVPRGPVCKNHQNRNSRRCDPHY